MVRHMYPSEVGSEDLRSLRLGIPPSPEAPKMPSPAGPPCILRRTQVRGPALSVRSASRGTGAKPWRCSKKQLPRVDHLGERTRFPCTSLHISAKANPRVACASHGSTWFSRRTWQLRVLFVQ